MEGKNFRNMFPMPRFQEFNYWFTWAGSGEYNVWARRGTMWDEATGGYTPEELAADPVWGNDFNMFTQRPEYFVSSYTFSDADHNNIHCEDTYMRYLIGCAFIRAGRNFQNDPDVAWPKLEAILEWLSGTDFFQAPASSQYHESIPGGLCIHTLKVIDKIKDLLKCDTFSTVNIEDAVLVALVHDWCKIGNYESYIRNVKDDATGQWRQVTAFRTKSTRMASFGHGVSSMYLAMKFFLLTHEEALAIRWHQGRWNVCREEMNEIQQSNEQYPLVHLIQFADQLSITNY